MITLIHHWTISNFMFRSAESVALEISISTACSEFQRNYGDSVPGIVFIKFAFACQSLEDPVLPSSEIQLFAEMLKADPVKLPSDLVDVLWFPPLEPEY